MTKIFITGIAGFLGSHLAEELIKQGHTVCGCDNLIGGYKENIPQDVNFYDYDCIDYARMNKAFQKEKPEIVYHLAASAQEGLSVFSPTLINRNTYLSTIGVLSASINNKVKRFIYASSMARYGNNKVPFTEGMKPNPQDPYAIAKVASEQQIKLLCDIHNMEYVIAVPHNIIGTRQKYDDPFRNVVSIFINRMLQRKPPIIYGYGQQKRCFSFVQDCVTPLINMMTFPINKEIINIGPDETFITIKKLAEIIAKKLNFKKPFIYMPSRPQEVKYATCSAKKARRLLKYKTTTSLSDGIDMMIEDIKKKGVKKFDYSLPLEIINEKIPTTWRDKLI